MSVRAAMAVSVSSLLEGERERERERAGSINPFLTGTPSTSLTCWPGTKIGRKMAASLQTRRDPRPPCGAYPAVDDATSAQSHAPYSKTPEPDDTTVMSLIINVMTRCCELGEECRQMDRNLRNAEYLPKKWGLVTWLGKRLIMAATELLSCGHMEFDCIPCGIFGGDR